ncbi:PREDICTED: probable lysine-specific demethylase ELF6 [Papilio xuthus]|uniref:Probable lysine-specific demethylase ELF6 n=1 Tax=Papilio xuthus TaxID=66420 RepID=A0AAJ6ZPG4_PAPXU|nr:PREDICTED: probable lysine-specific demethylase ELF6 [Papilio xuthus]
MFVSQDKNVKKKFQKPNILRRKTKPLSRPQATSESFESPDGKSLVSPSSVDKSFNSHEGQNRVAKQIVIKHREKPNQLINKSTQKLISASLISEDKSSNAVVKKENANDITFTIITTQENNNEGNLVQTGVNVDSFLVGGATKQNGIRFGNTELQIESVDKYDNTKWCLDLVQNSPTEIKEHYDGSQKNNLFIEQKLDVTPTMVPLSVVSSVQRNNIITLQGEVVPIMTNVLNSTFDLNKTKAKFKCEVADCDKEFSNKQKLKKHQNSHKIGSTRPPRQTNVECPIKIIRSGVEEPCGQMFTSREDVLKHLNENHTLEQANYICSECGRRFFWACALRAHRQAHGRARRGALVCAWPGCGRVFRQPCRLREHTRAHTGDKPYPCKFPNCGWSFRTASKLVRHARRHTGERRHACSACGRAFLRREHLREHHARHQPPLARHPHACTHHGCQQSFNNMSSLYTHMKKVHKKEETNSSNTTAESVLLEMPPENIFTVNMLKNEPVYESVTNIEVSGDLNFEEVTGSEEGLTKMEVVTEGMESAGEEILGEESLVAGEGEGEGQSARTHCTWPLQPRPPCGYHCEDAYVLDEDVQVEHSESAESNIYTIRSDLFLHGNALTNEDSQGGMGVGVGVGVGEGVGAGGGGALGDDLGLLDSHPTIDLMQEELLYTDAVDESSFRVFLLSEELT